jgi:spore coat polysaccharide biosynthesis protein SpsF
MGSRRLPGKVMLPLAGKPVIWHIFDRLRRVRPIEAVVLATTADPLNDEMVRYAAFNGMQVYRHDKEDDIAGRLAGVVLATNADAVLKINADCPAIDPAILQQIVDRYLAEPELDAVSNKMPFSWPLGMSAELFSARALQWCDRNLVGDEDRELVASWILKQSEQFRTASVVAANRYDVGDLLLDNQDDYGSFCRLFDALYRDGHAFGIAEIAAYAQKAPT